MKVVHLCNLPLPAGHPDYGMIQTHPGRWVLNLALAQKAHTKIQPILVVQIPGAKVDYQEEVEGIMVHYLAAPDRFRSTTLFYFDARRVSSYVRKLKPDLVHAHGTEDAYALAAQATGLPCALTVQGCYFIINRTFPPRLVSRERMVQFTEWLALRRAKHCIAKSAYVRDELVRAFPNLTIHEIPNTIDPRLLELPVDREREAGSLAFVGTLVPRKGVHLIADALALMQREDPTVFARIKLSVFGDRPGHESGYETTCKKRLLNLLGERVTFHGTIPAPEVAEALSRKEVLLAPSLEEMFGNQLIESVAVGADAIVSEGTAMAENPRLLRAGLVVPRGEAPALAVAICEALTHRITLAERGARRKNVELAFGPKAVARMHRTLYAKLMKTDN
ncbi:MAG: glycosyltransferase family 4 protein [Proteobacteria bacterium]|nr:glycosyltransferase family 4 protein [Pseudomonadota bacterium]